MVGDIAHSRVANSNLKLLMRMGAEIGVCTPEELRPFDKKGWKSVKHFESLEAGIKWADVIMCLRLQRERHSLGDIGFSMAEYRDKYHIGHEQMEVFRSDGVLLHPGPAVRGVEISTRALEDKRCRIIDQVENGSYIRSAVICMVLGLDVVSDGAG